MYKNKEELTRRLDELIAINNYLKILKETKGWELKHCRNTIDALSKKEEKCNYEIDLLIRELELMEEAEE